MSVSSPVTLAGAEVDHGIAVYLGSCEREVIKAVLVIRLGFSRGLFVKVPINALHQNH
jgi:hypothetical protein